MSHPSIVIKPFTTDHIAQAATLFAANFARLRAQIPALPAVCTDAATIANKLEHILGQRPGVAAFIDDALVGYMAWYLAGNFRGTTRKGAYCPEWAHATIDENKSAIYRALYREAAGQWLEAGCHTHAISLLAKDPEAEKVWFWSGFGMTCVDGIRPITPLDAPTPPAEFIIREATVADVPAIHVLEAEHWQHYPQPPTLMAPNEDVDSPEALKALIEGSASAIFIAEKDGVLASYLRFEGQSHGASTIVIAPTTVAITGAYTRPAFRRQSLAVALLNVGLAHFAAQGYIACSTDFESLNPEASAFWTRYFETVTVSLLRVPERVPLP